MVILRKIFLLMFVVGVTFGASQQTPATEDAWLNRPVDDRTYAAYLDLFKYDARLPLDVRSLSVETLDGIKMEHLSFQSTPGVRVAANLYRPNSDARNLPALITLHGANPLGKDQAGMKRVNEVLARAGWMALAIDMLHYGERKTHVLTTFTEENRNKFYNDQSLYLAWVTQTVKDVRRSFDVLVEHGSANPQRIGMVGISRGGIAASIAGAVETRLRAITLLSGGHNIVGEHGHLPAACPANYVGRIGPRALFMFHGTQDTVILPGSANALYRLAKDPKRILWDEVGHQAPSEEQLSIVLRWLQENLK